MKKTIALILTLVHEQMNKLIAKLSNLFELYNARSVVQL